MSTKPSRNSSWTHATGNDVSSGQDLFEMNFALHARRQKLENLGLLASGIAHDLNNIMTSILGNVSVLRLVVEKEPLAIETLQALEEGARRAAALTKKVLSLAASKKVELRSVDFCTVVEDCVLLLRPGLQDGITLTVNLPYDPCIIFGDSSELFQIVMNLLLNAAQSIPDKGCVSISLSRISTDDFVEFADGTIPRRFLYCLSVEDTGSGIPDSIKDRLFEPFFTTKNDRGSGLGLAVVRTIAEYYNGSISVSSTEGKGTRFDVYLPEEQLSEEGQTMHRDSNLEKFDSPRLPTGDEVILVVDDEEPVRTVIKKCLEHLGYQVTAVGSGAEGIKYYIENHDKCDLVILDMMMPGLMGDELFFRLKQINPGVKALIASGFASDERTRAVLNSGGLGFLEKPFSVDELAEKVRYCLSCCGPK